jgi:hypothetical protein
MRFGTVDAVAEGVTVVTVVVKTVVKQFRCSRSMTVQFLMGGEASNGLGRQQLLQRVAADGTPRHRAVSGGCNSDSQIFCRVRKARQ